MAKFIFNWVINKKIAIGNAPLEESDFQLIKNRGINSILTLCDLSEVDLNLIFFESFNWEQVVIPDHTYDRELSIKDLTQALNSLNKLLEFGPTLVHCKAGCQRSPLLCMAWLMQNKKISLDKALIYLMEINPTSNPMQQHLELMKKYFNHQTNISNKLT